jgi:hypothetical protein
MTELPDLKQLTNEATDALIVALWEALPKLRQKKPKKTSKNSSLPPTKGFKTEVKGDEQRTQVKREASVGREGGVRPLSENPDQTIKAIVIGLEISEGGIANLLTRVKSQLETEVDGILEVLRRARLVCSDEKRFYCALLSCETVGLEDSTRYQYRCRLYRDLKAALALTPTQEDGTRLQGRYRALQDNLFLFLDDPTIPATNNTSEQALHWRVIFRKVTNGFRSDWGRDLFANVRSVVNTGKQ